MRLDYASFSNIGPRENNQDRVLEPKSIGNGGFVAAIADGMGGADGGAEAAEIAIGLVESADITAQALPDIFSSIVETFRKISAKNPTLVKMGTTLTVGLLCEGAIHVCHVGDTRVYHLRGTGLNSLTRDQTEVAELVRKGVLTAGQARRYPRRNVLLSALSPAGEYNVESTCAKLEVGDRLLFVSDGVHQRVTRGAILNASSRAKNIDELVVSVEKTATDAIPSDNYTALGIEIISL